jgi:HK97 family phage major capsid protein
MELFEAKENINKLSEKIFDILKSAKDQNRALNAKEAGIISEMEDEINELRKYFPANSPLSMGKDFKIGGAENSGGGGSVRRDGAFALVGPKGQKDYGSLFGNIDYQWPDKSTNFFAAALSGRHHPGLIRNSMSETVPSDGGFLVPGEQAARIHAISLESELVLPRCYLQPMRSNSIKIPAMSVGDHSTALFGGFVAGYTAELGTISENSPKSRAMEMIAKKLTGLIRFSSELNADIPGGMGQIETLCGKGLSWYRDKAFLKGTGAGQPLGILNAGCTIEIEKETGQNADTIVYENLTKMMSRIFAGSFQNSVWVAHQTTIPQLLTLSLAIGTGGDAIPVMKESNGQFSILTRPVLFTEKTEPLGDKGDIMLCDFSQYVVALRSDMRFDTSIHVAFETDEILSRIIERHDGQPLWDSALTLEDGSTTVSPFVVLEAR